MAKDTFLWILQWLLAALLLMAGAMKLIQPREKLAEKLGWANDFSPNAVKSISMAEGLAASDSWCIPSPNHTDLSPLTATGLLLLMLGAASVHRRREETQIGARPVLPIARPSRERMR